MRYAWCATLTVAGSDRMQVRQMRIAVLHGEIEREQGEQRV